MDSLIESLHNLVQGNGLQAWLLAAAIIAVTAIVAHIATKLIRKVMQVDGLPIPESSIIVNIVRVVIWVLGISIMLSACFNVDVNALLAALGVGGVAVSLGLQDTFKNLFGGLQVTLLGIIKPNDHIVVGNVEGIVQDVSWRQTVVKDLDNSYHLIPNALINSTNVQKIAPELLVITRIAFINDGRDLDVVIAEMEARAKEAILKVTPLQKDPWILITEIGEYGIWGKMRFVLESVDHAREARDAALRAIAPYTRLNPEEASPAPAQLEARSEIRL